MQFTDRLRAIMAERGISQRSLAGKVPCSTAYVSLLVNGLRQPSRQMARRLDEVLAAGGDLEGLAISAARLPVLALELPSIAADPELYDRITRAVEMPARVDIPVIEWLERTLAEHRRVEDTIGARPILPLVRAQLAVTADFTRAGSAGLRDRLVDLSAQYAQFLAWMCIDTRNHQLALAWFDRAYDWASEAANANMAASVLSMKAHLAWSQGDARRCIRMAEAALWHRGVTPGLRGMSAQMAARGHALAGEERQARSLLGQAQLLMDHAARRPEAEPPWMYFYGDTWFRLQRGMIELHLGNWPDAATLLTAGLSELPDSYRRDRAWYGACLARAHAESGDAEQAAAAAASYAEDIAAVNSYARGELMSARNVLARRGARQAKAITDFLG